MPELADTAFAGAVAGLHERARTLGIREVLREPLQRKDIAKCFARMLPS